MVIQVKSVAVSDAEMRESVDRKSGDPQYLKNLQTSVEQAKAYVETLRSQKAK